jgi:hypothetical protein
MASKGEFKIARNMMVSASREHELKNRPGGSNVGEYANVSAENMAGNACGNPGSYPIDTEERARSALAYAHNAKNPDCIRRQVYKKYPHLDPDKK